MKRYEYAGIPLDDLTLEEARDYIRHLLCTGQRGFVVTPNAQHLACLAVDPQFAAAYGAAKLVLPDSVWLIRAARAAGVPLRSRCAGSDLFPLLLHVAGECNRRVFLLGGVNGSEQVAAHRMRTELGLTVSAYSPPFGFERDPAATSHIIQLINGFKPDMLFVHVGAPKSEVWLHEHFDKLDVTLAFSFGIALEYFAGTRRRAPQWVQRAGFEWLYRLCQEPGRLWKRYTIGSAQFGAIALREILRRYLWGDS